MGTVAIHWDTLDELNIPELNRFHNVLDKHNISINELSADFACEEYDMSKVFFDENGWKDAYRDMSDDELDVVKEEVETAYFDACYAFYEKTGVFLHLDDYNIAEEDEPVDWQSEVVPVIETVNEYTGVDIDGNVWDPNDVPGNAAFWSVSMESPFTTHEPGKLIKLIEEREREAGTYVKPETLGGKRNDKLSELFGMEVKTIELDFDGLDNLSVEDSL